VPSIDVDAIPVGESVTPPGVSVGVPRAAVLAKPVGARLYVKDSVGLPSADVRAIPVGEIVTAPGCNVGEPSAEVDALPVGLIVTEPGAAAGEPSAAVLPIPDAVIVCVPAPVEGAIRNMTLVASLPPPFILEIVQLIAVVVSEVRAVLAAKNAG
jgi:hypothetical protein